MAHCQTRVKVWLSPVRWSPCEWRRCDNFWKMGQNSQSDLSRLWATAPKFSAFWQMYGDDPSSVFHLSIGRLFPKTLSQRWRRKTTLKWGVLCPHVSGGQALNFERPFSNLAHLSEIMVFALTVDVLDDYIIIIIIIVVVVVFIIISHGVVHPWVITEKMNVNMGVARILAAAVQSWMWCCSEVWHIKGDGAWGDGYAPSPENSWVLSSRSAVF